MIYNLFQTDVGVTQFELKKITKEAKVFSNIQYTENRKIIV